MVMMMKLMVVPVNVSYKKVGCAQVVLIHFLTHALTNAETDLSIIVKRLTTEKMETPMIQMGAVTHAPQTLAMYVQGVIPPNQTHVLIYVEMVLCLEWSQMTTVMTGIM